MIADFAIHDKGTATLTPISCSPCGRWMKKANGSSSAARYTTLTRTAKESGSRPADGKAIRKISWTGTTRSTPESGGRDGRTRPTAIWKPMNDRNGLTCAPMPGKGLIKSPPSTWGQPPARWRRKESRPASAT